MRSRLVLVRQLHCGPLRPPCSPLRPPCSPLLPLGAALPLPLVHWDLAEVPGGVVALVQAVSEL